MVEKFAPSGVRSAGRRQFSTFGGLSSTMSKTGRREGACPLTGAQSAGGVKPRGWEPRMNTDEHECRGGAGRVGVRFPWPEGGECGCAFEVGWGIR